MERTIQFLRQLSSKCQVPAVHDPVLERPTRVSTPGGPTPSSPAYRPSRGIFAGASCAKMIPGEAVSGAGRHLARTTCATACWPRSRAPSGGESCRLRAVASVGHQGRRVANNPASSAHRTQATIQSVAGAGPNGCPLPVHLDNRLVADYPGIVTRRNRGNLPRTHLELGTVGHDNMHLSGDDVGPVRCHTRVRSGNRLDVVRPPPPGLGDDPLKVAEQAAPDKVGN